MMIGEVCCREVVIAKRDEPLIFAARLMRQYHVGDVVVVEERDGKCIPIGILTDRDMVVKVLAQGLDPHHLAIADVMSVGVETIGETEEIFSAAERMRAFGIRRLPVVDKAGALVGILAMEDVIDLLAEELRDLAAISVRERRRETFQV
ncbi:CBS domain-containing protein [Methylothermus subterraneus]